MFRRKREFALPLARTAVAVGVNGLFMEFHPEPDKALCNGPNRIKKDEVEKILNIVKAINDSAKAHST